MARRNAGAGSEGFLRENDDGGENQEEKQHDLSPGDSHVVTSGWRKYSCEGQSVKSRDVDLRVIQHRCMAKISRRVPRITPDCGLEAS